jgi:hypothetical protein
MRFNLLFSPYSHPQSPSTGTCSVILNIASSANSTFPPASNMRVKWVVPLVDCKGTPLNVVYSALGLPPKSRYALKYDPRPVIVCRETSCLISVGMKRSTANKSPSWKLVSFDLGRDLQHFPHSRRKPSFNEVSP